MAQASISVRVDEQDKRNFEAFCEQTGLNTSTAINMFIKAVIQHQRIPFVIEADPFYSPANMKRLRRSIAEMEKTGGTVHEVIDID